jgi:hypothetical protein
MDKALSKLKNLKNLYQDLEEVSAGPDLKVKLRLLSSEEETEVHTYSVDKYEQSIGFLYSVKRETLCKSIVFMNEVDIPEFVEDEDAKGNSEKIQRHIWLRENVVKGWSQLIIDELWKGYSRLMEKVENKINGGIKKEKSDEEENS